MLNALMLNEEGKPHYPLINSGAIMTCSLLKNELNDIPGEKFERIINRTWQIWIYKNMYRQWRNAQVM